MVESDDCRGDHCGWVGVKEAGGLSGGMGCSVWLGLYGSSGSAGASKRNDVSRRALPRWHRARATMPGSGSRIVTVGNRAALLQYQTSAEDGVCPPQGLPSAACLLPWSMEGRRRSKLPAYLPARRTACCIASASCRSSPKLGCGATVGEKYRPLYPGIYQCGSPQEAIVGGDWLILEIVGCPSFRDHTPCPKRQQHTSDPVVLGAGCWLLAAVCTMSEWCTWLPPCPFLDIVYLVPWYALERAESDSWWAHA